ncbi:cytoskeletal protein CcmA (bactofilin family) [Amorphus suaedae]
MADANEHQFYVGPETVVEDATVKVVGTAQVDGEVHGALQATHLIVGEKGRVTGTVTAETADIMGRVEGTVALSGQLSVRATGLVEGRVSYGSLAVEAGARLVGDLANGQSAAAGDSAPSAWRPSRVSRPATRPASRTTDEI